MQFSLDNLVGLSSSIQEDLLLKRGVSPDDVNIFLSREETSVDYEEDKYRLKNLREASVFLDKQLSQGDKKVMIVVDSDVDGYTSASII